MVAIASRLKTANTVSGFVVRFNALCKSPICPPSGPVDSTSLDRSLPSPSCLHRPQTTLMRPPASPSRRVVVRGLPFVSAHSCWLVSHGCSRNPSPRVPSRPLFPRSICPAPKRVRRAPLNHNEMVSMIPIPRPVLSALDRLWRTEKVFGVHPSRLIDKPKLPQMGPLSLHSVPRVFFSRQAVCQISLPLILILTLTRTLCSTNFLVPSFPRLDFMSLLISRRNTRIVLVTIEASTCGLRRRWWAPSE